MATLKQKIKKELDQYKEQCILDKRAAMIQDKGHYKKLTSTGVKDSVTSGE
jgi:hypothetical protein